MHTLIGFIIFLSLIIRLSDRLKANSDKSGNTEKPKQKRDFMNLKMIVIIVTTVLLQSSVAYSATRGDLCRSYALAVAAVANARDNLGVPTWTELEKKHPVLVKNNKNTRAILFPLMINTQTGFKNDSPLKLKKDAYDMCLKDYPCLFLSEGCSGI